MTYQPGPPQGQPQGPYGNPHGGPAPYGQMPGYAQPYGGPQLPDYKGWSILNIVLGFLFGFVGMVLGIIALTNADKITSAARYGDLFTAEQKSRNTRTMNIVATVVNVLGAILTILYFVFVFGETA